MADHGPERANGDAVEQADRLQRSAADLHTRRRWAEAEALALRASLLLSAEADAPAVGRACCSLAGTLDDLGDHAAAEVLYRRAGAILAALPQGGSDDALRIRCARGLASSLRRQQRNEEARPILMAALALSELLLGPSDGDTLATMTGLGLVCEGMGRGEEAEGLYRQALIRAEAATSVDPDEVAGIAASLSGLLERRAEHQAVRA